MFQGGKTSRDGRQSVSKEDAPTTRAACHGRNPDIEPGIDAAASQAAPARVLNENAMLQRATGRSMDNTRVFRMAFASVYPHYIAKAERKGRTKEEVHAIIHWLTGYDDQTLQQLIDTKVDFATFFARAPRINPNVSKITGVICGYRVEEIEDKLMQQIRYLDKLVDELAKGKAIDKILRK
jgi:hypothetical protein